MKNGLSALGMKKWVLEFRQQTGVDLFLLKDLFRTWLEAEQIVLNENRYSMSVYEYMRKELQLNHVEILITVLEEAEILPED